VQQYFHYEKAPAQGTGAALFTAAGFFAQSLPFVQRHVQENVNFFAHEMGPEGEL
jgi:hypothetical protein